MHAKTYWELLAVAAGEIRRSLAAEVVKALVTGRKKTGRSCPIISGLKSIDHPGGPVGFAGAC